MKIETRIIAARQTRMKIQLVGNTMNKGMRTISTKQIIVPRPDAMVKVAEVKNVSAVKEIKTVKVSTVAIRITSAL